MSEQNNNRPNIPLLFRDSTGAIRPAITPEEQEMAREQIRQHQENRRINPDIRDLSPREPPREATTLRPVVP